MNYVIRTNLGILMVGVDGKYCFDDVGKVALFMNYRSADNFAKKMREILPKKIRSYEILDVKRMKQDG